MSKFTILRTSAGLEITASDLHLAVLRESMGRLRLAHLATITGFVQMADEEKKRSVSELVKKHGIAPARVHLSLLRENGIVRQIEFPVEVRERLQSAVGLQIEALSPWPLAEIHWDCSHAPPGKGAKTFLATVVIIPKALLDPWIQFFKSVGLPLSGASLSSVACAHGASVLWPEGKPAIILACEPGSVAGSLVQTEKLDSLTISGTETAIQFRSAAERLLSMGRVADPDAVRLVVYGSSAASVEGVPPLRLPLESADPASGRQFGVIAAAFGGMRRGPFNTNLVPRDLRYRRSQLQLIPTYVLIALTVLMGLAMLVREPYQMVLYASRIDSEIQRVAPEVRDVSAQEAELNQLSEKYRVLAGHFQQRDQNVEALLEMSRMLPPATWLTNYTYQNEMFAISGFADSASEVQKLIEDSPLFKDAQFTASVTRDPVGQDRFSLRMNLEVRQ